MKELLLFTIAFLFSLSVFSQEASVKTPVCDNVFDYEISETSNTEFNILINNSSNDNFTFKLFSISEGVDLVTEISSENFNEKIEFEGLDKNNVYLVQVYGISSDCRFTIGGMKGIKYENK